MTTVGPHVPAGPVPGRLDSAFLRVGASSFADFIAEHDSRLLPRIASAEMSGSIDVPHGTTIVALTFPGGVVMAGDRRATAGNVIANRDITKVYAADDHSVVGIAGVAGLALELVRLFQVELEHYEKLEGMPLSLDGKANRLSTMIRSNLGMVLQGLAVVPLFAGYDTRDREGRIYSYDVTGGRYQEQAFHSVGSGSTFARGSLKKLYRDDLDADTGVEVCLQALFDAADDDSATGLPDMARRIFPVVAVVTAQGVKVFDTDGIEPYVQRVMDSRRGRPDGPLAPVN